MKNIVMCKENPMNTRIFNYRVEFQARGAAHIHAVLWIDFDKALPHNLNNSVIKSAFRKFRRDVNLFPEEEQEVIKFIDTFVTCTTDKVEAKKLLLRDSGDKDAIASRVVNIAATVNRHKHSKSCRKYNTKCRFSYPKLPSLRTILTKDKDIYYKDELNSISDDIIVRDQWIGNKMKTSHKILDAVGEVLFDYD